MVEWNMLNQSLNKSLMPASSDRTILVVCGDTGYESALRDAWNRLQLVDRLHVVRDKQEALSVLENVKAHTAPCETPEVAAVVLDPDTTGEETAEFVRAARSVLGSGETPVIFWARLNSGYKVLEGKTVDAVVNKPMVLKLIQELESTCGLQARAFHPFPGGLSL